jgi:RNA recognition motif-containing protein
MEVKLYVGNLSYETSEEDLRTLFAQAGAVASVALIKDRDTGRSKGFAFIEMTTQAEAQKAISLYSGYKMNDRDLTVNLARPREERGGYQSRLSAGGELNRKASKPRPDQGGYRGKLSAFGNGSGPTGPRRRGGNHHY